MARRNPSSAAQDEGRARLVAGLSCILAILAIGAAAVLGFMHTNAAKPSPTPLSIQDRLEGVEAPADDDGFPEVDWESWQGKAPGIIGWITIPGTNVDYPICQAPEDDPGFYLTHDAQKGWNLWGCPYLDADCSEGGLLDSANAVILGHHMDDGTMFADVSKYTDEDWAASHMEVLIQTPTKKLRLTPVAADVINASHGGKRTEFSGREDFEAWAKDSIAQSDAVFETPTDITQMYTLVTCSYHTWSNERTVVYCIEERS